MLDFLFDHELWVGTILTVLLILLVARFLANRLGSYWYLLAALLLWWLYQDNTHPHDAWLFDLQWPFIIIVVAILGVNRVSGRTWWNGRPVGKAAFPIVGSVLVWFILYTSLFLPMNFFHELAGAPWDGLVSFLVLLAVWGGMIITVIGTMLWSHSGGGSGGHLAVFGHNAVRFAVIFAMLFTVLSNIPTAYKEADQGVRSWWEQMDQPNQVIQSDRDALGQKPSATATGTPSTASTASPAPESRGGMVDNSLEQETIDAVTVANGAEASPCDWTGVETKNVAVPEGATNNDTDVDQTMVVYKPGFAAAVGSNGRRYSDSIQLPLKGSETVDQSKDLKRAICEDPLQGAAVANMFAGIKIGDQERPLTEFNPWLQPFAVEVEQVNDLAAGYMPHYEQKELTSDQAKEALTKNVEYQVLANRLGTLLDRLGAVGVQSHASDKTWHLSNGGISVGGVPEVGLDPRKDTKPSLVYQLSQKNACEVLLRVGFNTADKRPEVFKLASCAEQAKQTKAAKTAATATKSAASTQKPATVSTPSKPLTTNKCKIDWQPGCPPNAGDQDPQSNDIDTGPSDPDGSPDPISGTIVVPDS